MDIQAEKLDLIKWVIDLDDKSIIYRLIELKNEYSNDWDQLTSIQKAHIEEARQHAGPGVWPVGGRIGLS